VVETFEVSISDPVSGETVEVEIDVNSISETIAEVTVETDIAPVETFEMEVEVETVETVAEVEAEIEETVSEQVEVEVAETETETAENTEQNESNEDADAKEEPKTQEPKQSKEKQQKAKARIATAIVNNIISKLGSNASDQVTQLILMNAIGAGYKDTKQMPDNNNWYQKVAIYDVKQLPDPAGQMYSFAQDRTMDKLIDLQYQ
jgi:chemotaxis protein histidine kinase CheA